MLINNYATKLGDNSELKLKPPAVCLNKKNPGTGVISGPGPLRKKECISELYQRYHIQITLHHTHRNKIGEQELYKFRRSQSSP